MHGDRVRWAIVAAVALGGALGSAARYALAVLVETGGGLPWATLAVNVSGCLLIGALMEVLNRPRSRPVHRLARPFLGTGVLGGFTTFSAYAVEVVTLVDAGRTALAAVYVVGTVLLALLATVAGGALVSAVTAGREPAVE